MCRTAWSRALADAQRRTVDVEEAEPLATAAPVLVGGPAPDAEDTGQERGSSA